MVEAAADEQIKIIWYSFMNIMITTKLKEAIKNQYGNIVGQVPHKKLVR